MPTPKVKDAMEARRPQFDLNRATRALERRDPELGAWIGAVGACRLELRPSVEPLPTLVRTIVYQQLSGKAARTIHERLLVALGGPLDAERLAATHKNRLRAAGLSRAKAAALHDLAAKVQDGTVPDAAGLAALDDEAVIERLCEVRGIGRWSAEMFLMFSLGRPDVMSVGDLGLRKGFRRVFGMTRLPATRTFERRAELWRPWRTVACWYLWRAADDEEFW
jgi:DNA-3-methyladenine glycosylase II